QEPARRAREDSQCASHLPHRRLPSNEWCYAKRTQRWPGEIRLADGSVALDDRGEVDPARERPVHPAVAGEERVGDRRIAVAPEQRSLQAEREPLDEPARVRLVDVADGWAEIRIELREECLQRLRLAPDRAEHIERDDVARALPDRRQRLLAI